MKMISNKSKVTRRDFTRIAMATSAGMLLTSNLLSGMVAAPRYSPVKVATASISSYDEILLKDAVEKSFANLGGIEDIIQPGSSVGIKINLTGGAAQARTHRLLSGLHPGESYWTNPTLLKVIGQAILEAGAEKLYILESLSDWDSYNEFGYKEVVEQLGATFIDLNEKAPYDEYITKTVGDKHYIYPELTLNGIFNELDCFVSMPKAKQHATSGVTHGLKNLIGTLPIPSGLYNAGGTHRAAIHQLKVHDGVPNNNLCRVILDVNRANPINLVVNDAIKTVLGSEGPWTKDGMTPTNFDKLIIGKDPVAVDSVSSDLMGLDPMAEDNTFPFVKSINYLKLASEQGLGEYNLDNIEVLNYVTNINDKFKLDDTSVVSLKQNYPNPFRSSTTIQFDVQKTMKVNLKIYDVNGREIAQLFNHRVSAGSHKVIWNANGLKSGKYYCKISAGKIMGTKQLVLAK